VARISAPARLDHVEHIIGSGTGILEFAVEGESEYYTWEGSEEADWEVEGVSRVENIGEDRFMMYPGERLFVCEIEEGDERVSGDEVRCWSKVE
jgi:hypothetical protein